MYFIVACTIRMIPVSAAKMYSDFQACKVINISYKSKKNAELEINLHLPVCICMLPLGTVVQDGNEAILLLISAGKTAPLFFVPTQSV